jgi:environmental stress-induced protein Ves
VLRRLAPAVYRRMPWRNGGGTRTEIAIAPEGAAVTGARFLYRVSIADVASDGPFSRFEGYDRHIMLLEGAGMRLDCGAHGRIELAAPFEPHAFSGDWDVRGTLVAGPVRDLNVIVDRDRASATLEVRVVEAAEAVACGPGCVCIVHVIEGALAGAARGDTLVAGGPFELVPEATAGAARVARVALARIALRATA